jgi:MFS superfamily sulfate permease-like transporter
MPFIWAALFVFYSVSGGFMGSISTESIILYVILAVVVALLVAGFFFLRKKMKAKLDDQQALVNQHKVPVSILVLEKRKDRVVNANIPKTVLDQIPKIYKVRKVPIVKAKIGPQVMDLLCDEEVFERLPERKTVRVDMAGIFIAGFKTGKK